MVELSFYKKSTDDNPKYFWIVTVQDWYKTSMGKPLGMFNFSNVIDIDVLLFRKSKINAAFLVTNE